MVSRKGLYFKGNKKKRACQICICNTVCNTFPKCGRKGCKEPHRQDRSVCVYSGQFPCQWIKDTNNEDWDSFDKVC